MASKTITIISEKDEKGAKPGKKKIDKEKVEKSLLDKLIDSDDVTFALDVVSALGVAAELTGIGAVVGAPVSIAADLVNAIRMAARGDLMNAGLYTLFAVPAFGDALQGAKFTGLAGKGGVELVMKVLKYGKGLKDTKAMHTAYKLIDKIPGSSEHKPKLKKSVKIMMSGDADLIAGLAEESGHSDIADAIEKEKFDEKPDEKSEKKELSEARRSRSLLPLYERSLYGRND